MNTSYVPKNCTLPVLDYIPYHWKEIRSKYLLEERDDRSSDGNEDLLSVSQYTGVTKKRKQISGSNDSRASSLEGYKQVDQDNLVINIMLAWNGSLGVSKYQGIVSPAYGVYKINNVVYPTYLHYLVKSEEYKTLFRMYSTGVIDSRLRLYSDQLFSLRFIVPSYTEQEQIAHYLDYKNHLINKYIRIKKRQIELLKELKQVVINDAVTGKIDVRTGKPYPRYKDSGIDWIGMIPEEWEASRVKYLCNINANTLPENTDPEFRFIYHDIGSVGTGELLKQAECTKFAKSPSRARRVVYTNDVIISTVRTYLKAVYSFENITEPTVVSTGFAVFTPREMLLPKLLKYCMLGESFIQQVVINSVGIGYPAINESVLERLFLIYPNDVQTQITIGSFLEEKTRGIDLLHERLSLSIFKLKELQTRLISDVVTGKLDVRDIEIPDYDEEQEEYDEVVVEDSLEEVGDAD